VYNVQKLEKGVIMFQAQKDVLSTEQLDICEDILQYEISIEPNKALYRLLLEKMEILEEKFYPEAIKYPSLMKNTVRHKGLVYKTIVALKRLIRNTANTVEYTQHLSYTARLFVQLKEELSKHVKKYNGIYIVR
jgi:hypothetical protein